LRYPQGVDGLPDGTPESAKHVAVAGLEPHAALGVMNNFVVRTKIRLEGKHQDLYTLNTVSNTTHHDSIDNRSCGGSIC
jgi:hypothetical protein